MNKTPAMNKQPLTGKPSIDRPWLKYYPAPLTQIQIPECTMNQYLKDHCGRMENIAIHYYGTDLTWTDVFAKVERTARALRAVGFKENDQIPVFLYAVPEFIYLFLAAERIGAALVSRHHQPQENAQAVANAGSSLVFVQDSIGQADVDEMEKVGAKKFILLSPYESADRKNVPDHINFVIDGLYSGTKFTAETMTWEEFLALGDSYTGVVDAEIDIDRPIYRAYTTGSTGPSKQVIHSAHSIIGVLQQMNFYGASDDFRPTWLLTILLPFLISVVISMILLPLASNKLLILDPFCAVEDIDLEMMHYRPNCWPLIPLFMESLMKSKRIPDDYDMSHLMSAGAGCETFNNGQVKRMQKFLKDHKCEALFTVGYGQSEAGSNAIFHCPNYPVGNGCVGIPMPLVSISIFKPGTQEELSYNETGEICICTPGCMLGYDDPVKTAKAIQIHPDGKRWLHTGDTGYMDENGCLFVLGRGYANRYNGGYLSEISMENRVVDANIPGLKDEFFVIVGDKEHPGCYVPYMYAILEEGYQISDIENAARAVLEDFEQPVEIFQLPERPFFQFKTNRIGLSRKIGSTMAAFVNN